MLPLAKAFQNRGHSIAWATSPDALSGLLNNGFELFAVGLAMDDARCIFQQRWPAAASLRGEEYAGYTFARLFGGVVAPAMLVDLDEALVQYAPNLVIFEPAALAMPLACQRRGVSYVVHGYGLKLPQFLITEALREFGSYWLKAGLEPPQDAGLYRGLYIDIVPPSLQAVSDTRLSNSLLLNAASVSQPQGPDFDESLLRAMAVTARPTIYLTFGTVFNQLEAFRIAATGLSRLDALVIVTIGRDGKLDNFSNLPENVYVARYIDQAALLKHCSLVVSHGGAGTVLGAAAYGVPQLILPQAADHFRNARALCKGGVGLVIGGDQCTADAIQAGALFALMTPAFTIASRRLAEEIRSMPTPYVVVSSIEKIFFFENKR
jgi:UDP:flavonoid glycosyltransferase YjiC (YdhE family)